MFCAHFCTHFLFFSWLASQSGSLSTILLFSLWSFSDSKSGTSRIAVRHWVENAWNPWVLGSLCFISLSSRWVLFWSQSFPNRFFSRSLASCTAFGDDSRKKPIIAFRALPPTNVYRRLILSVSETEKHFSFQTFIQWGQTICLSRSLN